MNVIQHPLKSIKGPSIKKGWLRKKARKGLFKNWKTRFFVIANGKISYYRNEISEYPYGNSLKVRIASQPSEHHLGVPSRLLIYIYIFFFSLFLSDP